MRSLTLADATDLISWADRRDSQSSLPTVVRRLVYATLERITRASFPSGEAVQSGGWDGGVIVEQGNAFVPDGVSGWELSSDKSIISKADADYGKRTSDPQGVDPAKSTYVAVTLRRWKKKTAWQESRLAEGVWRDVRAYDADDLECWLERAPAVHIWLSVLLGKRSESTLDLENWWADWSTATDPPIRPELVLAGRGQAVDSMHEWLCGTVSTMATRSESRDEALAFLAAAVQRLPEEERCQHLSRIAVARDEASLDRLATPGTALILIADMDCDADALSRAVRNGHRVVVLLGGPDTPSPTTLSIPRISTDEATRVLAGVGIPDHKAREYAGLARRSLTSFRRKLAVRPEVQRPDWASPAEARPLLPAVLAGRWNSLVDGDRQALAALASSTYEGVSGVLVRWSSETDMPVRRIGDTWHVVSKEDAWHLLARYITGDDLKALEKVVLDVLGTPNPCFDLPAEDRWKAQILGHTPQHSGLLSEGLCDTLAIMGALSECTQLATSVTSGDAARRIVRELLGRANTDWRLWASLTSVLPLLAEAAPDEFLAAVDEGLQGDSPILGVFDESEGPFTSSPHCGLLWALESIAWSADHLSRVTLLLGKLARLDPGGKLTNRPENSLREIFLLWRPQTSATLEQRSAALDALARNEPGVAWKLIRRLLPSFSEVAMRTHSPRWRDWVPDAISVSEAEYYQGIRGVVQRLCALLGSDGRRWADMIEALPHMPPDEVAMVIERLEALGIADLPDPDCALIRDSLRKLVSAHRSHPDAKWALPTGITDRLCDVYAKSEPVDPVRARVWLFTDCPHLPDGLDHDFRVRGARVLSAQTEAVRSIVAQHGVPGILGMISRVDAPHALGYALGQSGLAAEMEEGILTEYLAAEDESSAKFGRGYACGCIGSQGRAWAESQLARMSDLSAAQAAELLVCLPCDQHTWTQAETLGDDTDRHYWRLLSPYAVHHSDYEAAVRKFLLHGRPYTAVSVLSFALRKHPLPVGLLAEALEDVLRTDPQTDPNSGLVSHDIAELLDYLAESGEMEESKIAGIEWAFLPVLDRYVRQPKLLHRELGRSAEFFAEVVALVYRAAGEEPRTVSAEDKARAERGWDLLGSWRTVPGTREGGMLDADVLHAWVRRARELSASSGRADMGDQAIGEMLSGSPAGEDGSWPHPAVRDVIEEVAGRHLESGVTTGVYNSRGVVTKSPREGGAQERRLADRYAGYAEGVAARWPRTASLLRRIADGYRAEAREEDARAELREDLD